MRRKSRAGSSPPYRDLLTLSERYNRLLRVIEPQVLAVFAKIVEHAEIGIRRWKRILIADQAREGDLQEVFRQNEAKLKTNLEEQKKLFRAYAKNLMPVEVYENEAANLRIDEHQIRKERERLEGKLIAKETSQEYHKRLEGLLASYGQVEVEVPMPVRRQLLQLVFKAVTVGDQKIVDRNLWPPFDREPFTDWLE